MELIFSFSELIILGFDSLYKCKEKDDMNEMSREKQEFLPILPYNYPLVYSPHT